jgi:sodium pump decarboxylase gamma subunit
VAEEMIQGLTISVLGMGLVFAALGLLVLVMLALRRISTWQAGRPGQPPPVPSSTAEGDSDELARVAAIAVALPRAGRNPSLGHLLEADGAGGWPWFAHQQEWRSSEDSDQ